MLFIRLDNSSNHASFLSADKDVLSWRACLECDFSMDFHFGKKGFEQVYQDDGED